MYIRENHMHTSGDAGERRLISKKSLQRSSKGKSMIVNCLERIENFRSLKPHVTILEAFFPRVRVRRERGIYNY